MSDLRRRGRAGVPFLRPFEWIAPTLTSFRERPLPSEYSTLVVPTFDLFGTSRVTEVQFETVAGTLGLTEVTLPQVEAQRYRIYLSFAFLHDDAVAQVIQAVRIVPGPGGGFPFQPLTDPARDGVAPRNQWFTARNVTVPPEGRIGALAPGLGVGSRITLRGIFIEYAVGEPHASLT